MKIKLITHDRVAHADETFAVAILQIALAKYPIEVVRTRNPVTLRSEAGAPGTFLLDVGGVYDPARRLFDHHQPEGAGYRNPELREWPMATAGLVWKHYGNQTVLNMHPDLTPPEVAEVVDVIDDTVLKFIDAVDCGVRLKSAGPSLSGIIASFNAAWYETEEDPFTLVTELARVLLQNFINRQVGKIKARQYVRNARPELGGKLLVLSACRPWTEVVSKEMPEVLMVAYPVGFGAEQTWQMRTAISVIGTKQEPRIMLPAAWGGLERQALAQVCGQHDAIFCHRSLHLAGAKTYEGIVAMAEKALQLSKQSSSKEALACVA